MGQEKFCVIVNICPPTFIPPVLDVSSLLAVIEYLIYVAPALVFELEILIQLEFVVTVQLQLELIKKESFWAFAVYDFKFVSKI